MANPKNKRTFKLEIDGEEKEFAVLRPTFKHEREAKKVYNRTFRERLDDGDWMRKDVYEVMRERGLWDDELKDKYESTLKNLKDGEEKLNKGGIKASEAKEIALQMRRDRNLLTEMNREYNRLDELSAEAQADDEEFHYKVSMVTVDAETGEQIWGDFDLYNAERDTELALQAGLELSRMLYNADEDALLNLPENKFLRNYKFTNEKGHLVNKEGHLINTKGELVDSEGHLVNENDERIDEEGNVIQEEEFTPFLDDEGEPILLEDEEETTAPNQDEVAQEDPVSEDV